MNIEMIVCIYMREKVSWVGLLLINSMFPLINPKGVTWLVVMIIDNHKLKVYVAMIRAYIEGVKRLGQC